MSKEYGLVLRYKTHLNDVGFFGSPVYFNYFYDAVKYMDSVKDLTPWKHIEYCHIEQVGTNYTWDFPFFKR